MPHVGLTVVERDWDRTSDPCDVNAGAPAQPIDFAKTDRAVDLPLSHQCAAYVLTNWFNEPKSTVLQGEVSVLCSMTEDAHRSRRCSTHLGEHLRLS